MDGWMEARKERRKELKYEKKRMSRRKKQNNSRPFKRIMKTRIQWYNIFKQLG